MKKTKKMYYDANGNPVVFLFVKDVPEVLFYDLKNYAQSVGLGKQGFCKAVIQVLKKGLYGYQE